MLAAVITLSDDREKAETATDFVTQRSHACVSGLQRVLLSGAGAAA
jgi:hypothetical protein